jgi:DNA-binding CsgD family transcriptional regulator
VEVPFWLGAGGREAAAARLRRASPIAERLGARPLAEQIADLSRRAGETPAGDAAASGDRLGLTGREFEVLRLVAAGQSNRDIASALFISPKTASVHVSNILAKLGASTRTEAAAKAHALRLFEDPGELRQPAKSHYPERTRGSAPPLPLILCNGGTVLTRFRPTRSTRAGRRR